MVDKALKWSTLLVIYVIASSKKTNPMRICVAQTRPIAGDIGQNVERHKPFVNVAVATGADVLIFPELSLTGYEPDLANALATTPDDNRFDLFQQLSDATRITLGVGIPLRSNSGILISLLIFQPNQPRQVYSKQYLHADEEPYFVPGQAPTFLIAPTLALAICYELSVPEHLTDAVKNGATIYVASVAKSASGVERAVEQLTEIAQTYSMTVLMANSVGPCDNFIAAGKSSVWNNKGVLVGQLDEYNEGVLIMDTNTQRVIRKTL